MPDVKIGVSQHSLNTSTGVQTFTNANLGGKTPKAALAFMTNATVADTVTANAHLSLGATDGTNEWALAVVSEDDVTPSDVGKRAYDDRFIAGVDENNLVELSGQINELTANSTAVNFTDASPEAYLANMIQFAGDDVEAEVATLFVQGAVSSTHTLNFTNANLNPDLLVVVQPHRRNDGASASANYFSIGIVSNINGVLENYCVFSAEESGDNPTERIAVVRNNRCAWGQLLSGADLNGLECTSISAGSAEFTLRESSFAADDINVLALSFGGAKVKAGTIETPANSGVDWNVTGVGFKPQAVLSAWTAITGAYNTVKTDGEACSLNLWAFDANGAGSAGIRSQDAATTTSTDSRSGSDLLVRDNTGATLVDLDAPVFNSDGWTVAAADIATANATARQGIYVAVEDLSATIAPITGSTSVAFGSSAYAAAINQIAGSTSFGFATAAQAAAINQIAASVTLQFTGTAALLNITPPPVVESGLWAESEDDRLSFFDLEEFGSTATINAAQVAGILEEPNVQIDVGEGPVMSASAPIFYCRTSDVSGIAIGQTVSISNPLKTGVFSVVEIRPDGDGITALVLHDA